MSVMKRPTASRVRPRLIMFALAVTAIAIAAPVSIGAASTNPGDHIEVMGSGVRTGSVPFTFSLNAHTPAHSVGVYGTFSGSFPGLVQFSGEVTCLKASGGIVTVGGVITEGYGIDPSGPGGYGQGPRDLTGDWFFTTVQDPPGDQPDTMGLNQWGDRSFYTSLGYTSFSSVCDNPYPAVGGTTQLPLSSGDIHIDS
jgi:hypothetical protein